ncbi:MAG: EscU/YscU/HrcU family type III secretion system export apparatus switch protein [Candidatus Pristimantibacillus lignocellulolyticus]|uniref:EscU/YscU/HrcU family type III secretion system export apparatus switch protein n=1 Tax=Candidatus Pristimantibacillus lignocellulolyticus TaxID=2994561 RepID=A0A9J6ZB12_9BACL|nr:MAG: EscU/YscU/HrcU family type III secretion system export apparatus switch protein [Candidatus Pristimantibacillus lignocellulolyticus]
MNEQPPVTKMRKAVAMKYDPMNTTAPTLIAKGQGELAERILAKAKENGVPIQEDQSLVEVLSKLDIDQEIPPELFAVVAEILSFVYRADRNARDWPL